MESNSPKVEIKPSLLISHKSIDHICPLSWLVSGVLNSGLYGTYCKVYSVQYNLCTFFSLFVWPTWLARHKQNEVSMKLSKVIQLKLEFSIHFLLSLLPLIASDRLSYVFYSTLCNMYCTQCNVRTMHIAHLVYHQDFKILN